MGSIIGLIKGDTRSLDYGSYEIGFRVQGNELRRKNL